VNFHAVETGRFGVAGGLAELVHHARNFAQLQGPGGGHFLETGAGEGLRALRLDGRRAYRQLAVVEEGVRHPAHVPELGKNPPAGRVYGLGNFLPGGYLRLGVNAGRINVAHALRRHLGALGDDEARRGALHIVGHHRVGGSGFGVGGAAARHGGHDDAVGQLNGAEFEG
jgi:hypothetical protein